MRSSSTDEVPLENRGPPQQVCGGLRRQAEPPLASILADTKSMRREDPLPSNENGAAPRKPASRDPPPRRSGLDSHGRRDRPIGHQRGKHRVPSADTFRRMMQEMSGRRERAKTPSTGEAAAPRKQAQMARRRRRDSRPRRGPWSTSTPNTRSRASSRVTRTVMPSTVPCDSRRLPRSLGNAPRCSSTATRGWEDAPTLRRTQLPREGEAVHPRKYANSQAYLDDYMNETRRPSGARQPHHARVSRCGHPHHR